MLSERPLPLPSPPRISEVRPIRRVADGTSGVDMASVGVSQSDLRGTPSKGWTLHLLMRSRCVVWQINGKFAALLLPTLLLVSGMVSGAGWQHWSTAGRVLRLTGMAMQPSSLWPLTGLPSRWPRLDGYMADRQSFDVEQALARARSLGLGSHSAAARLLGGIVEKSWIHAASQLAKPSDTLHWPVPSGWYVRGWGSGEGGYHLAVDIMGATGERVLAAAGGIVGYAGNAVRGYGNLVMVIHAGGWVTIYAHNSRNLVVAGQQVRGGESIALVGSTGISRGPHVHFEFVVNGRNCDPVPLFRPAVRHRDGRDANVRQLAWTTGEPSPAGVSCDRRRRHPHSRWHQHHDEVSTTLD